MLLRSILINRTKKALILTVLIKNDSFFPHNLIVCLKIRKKSEYLVYAFNEQT